jgi:hypothetical protein
VLEELCPEIDVHGAAKNCIVKLELRAFIKNAKTKPMKSIQK